MRLELARKAPPQADIGALRAKIADLERTERALREDLRRLGEEKRRRAEDLSLTKKLVDNALDGITVTSMTGVVMYANPAFGELSGFGNRVLGSNVAEYYSPEDFATVEHEVIPSLVATGRWCGILRIRRPDGSHWQGQTSAFLITGKEGEPVGMAAIYRDITAQLEAARELEEQKAQVIEAQRATLRELGTPMIPIADAVIAMPLIGAIDTARAAQILEALLKGIAAHRAAVAILDITGVKVVDVAVARALVGAARAAKLLGAEVILTGIRPAVAQSLVEIGTDLEGIITLASFQSGIAHALGRASRRPQARRRALAERGE